MKNITTVLSSMIAGACLLGLASLQAGEIPVESCKVTASKHETAAHGDFKPENTLDGKIDDKSTWRGEGKGVWIQYDVGKVRTLESIRMAFMSGDKRTFTFDLLLSEDGAKWVPVATQLTSSGKTKDYEIFPLKETKARYVRVVGHGGSSQKFPEWFNLSEVRIDEKESAPSR